MTRNRRLLLVFSIITVLLVAVYLAWLLFFPLHRLAPKVIGIETASQTQFTRRIVYEGAYRIVGWMPGPEGGRDIYSRDHHYFLETPNSRKELTFLTPVFTKATSDWIAGDYTMAVACLPVQNNLLWVCAGYFHLGPQIEIIVFDPTGIRSQRTIIDSPDEHNPGNDFWFENGNRILRFRSVKGTGTYDIVNDKVTP